MVGSSSANHESNAPHGYVVPGTLLDDMLASRCISWRTCHFLRLGVGVRIERRAEAMEGRGGGSNLS